MQREYRACWQIDPLFGEYLATIGHVYFQLPRSQAGMSTSLKLNVPAWTVFLIYLLSGVHFTCATEVNLIDFPCLFPVLSSLGGIQGLLGAFLRTAPE